MENKKNEIFIVSVEDTIKYGIIKAAIIGRVRMWCEHNKKNKVKDRFHNGEWWSGFMTYDEFATQLGIPVKTIEKHLPQLIKTGILITDKFNKKGFDRTSWYRVNPSPQIEGMIPPNRGDGNPQIEGMETPKSGEPIPVNHLLISESLAVNPDIYLDVKNENNGTSILGKNELKDFEKTMLKQVIKTIFVPDEVKETFINMIDGFNLTKKQLDNVFKWETSLNKNPGIKKFLSTYS
jgi:hypothetical protein